MRLLRRLAGLDTPLVSIVLAGRPLCIGEAAELCDATLFAWHPGTMWGPALVDLLFGDAAPSGKLPISFPRNVGQIPIYHSHRSTGRPPRVDFKGIPTGTPLDPIDMDASVEVAQLYVRDRLGSVTRPVRELKGFQRVALAAGESRRVVFRLHPSELAFYGRDLATRVEPGTFDVVGGSGRATTTASFELVESQRAPHHGPQRVSGVDSLRASAA